MLHGTLQTVLAEKALAMDSPMPQSFLHQIVCDIVDKSKQLTMANRVWELHLSHTSLHIKLCGMYVRTEMCSLDWLCGMYIRTETYSLDRLCVIYIRTKMFFWDSPCGMYIPTEMIFLNYRVGCTYLRKWLGFDASPDLTRASFCARRAYPRRFLGRVGRTPPMAHTHLAMVPNAVAERGFKPFV